MGGRISGERDWTRVRRVVPVASPAAGQDWTLTVPGGHVYRVLTVYEHFVTAIAAATRVPRLVFTDGNVEYLDVAAFASQAASLTRDYSWWEASSGDSTGTAISSGMPVLDLPAGWTIGSATDNLQAADQWSAVYLLVIDTMVRSGDIYLDELPEMVVEMVYGSAKL